MPVRKNVSSSLADLNRSYVSAERVASGSPFHTVGAAWLKLLNASVTYIAVLPAELHNQWAA